MSHVSAHRLTSSTVSGFQNYSRRSHVCSHCFTTQITVLGYAAAHVITPRKMEPCFDNYTLAEATPLNQAKLKKFIDALTISGSAQFEVVLDKIFSFINHPSDRGWSFLLSLSQFQWVYVIFSPAF